MDFVKFLNSCVSLFCGLILSLLHYGSIFFICKIKVMELVS